MKFNVASAGSLARMTSDEEVVLDLVKRKLIRLVHSQRKRKLKKKGVSVDWSPSIQSWFWVPGDNGVTL